MNYSYLVADKHAVFDVPNTNKTNIICYRINIDTKYPFLQFMLVQMAVNKIPLLNFIHLPHFMQNADNTNNNLIEVIQEQVCNVLNKYGYNSELIDNTCYKGTIFDDNHNLYIMYDISCVDTQLSKKNNLNMQQHLYFVLATEIINFQSINGIKIDKNIVDLFLKCPQLGILHKYNTKDIYSQPDVAFIIAEQSNESLIRRFGPVLTNKYELPKPFYFLYSNYDAARDMRNYLKKTRGNTYVIVRTAYFCEDYAICHKKHLKDQCTDDHNCIIITDTQLNLADISVSEENILLKNNLILCTI